METRCDKGNYKISAPDFMQTLERKLQSIEKYIDPKISLTSLQKNASLVITYFFLLKKLLKYILSSTK